MVRDRADERLADRVRRARIASASSTPFRSRRTTSAAEADALVGTPRGIDAERPDRDRRELDVARRSSTLLKRPDELHVVEQAHLPPEIRRGLGARDDRQGVVDAYPELEDDAFVYARQLNFETIHSHDVLAERTGLLGELRASLRGGDGGAHARSTTGSRS